MDTLIIKFSNHTSNDGKKYIDKVVRKRLNIILKAVVGVWYCIMYIFRK